MRLLLVNPNTSPATTRQMLDLAQAAGGHVAEIEGRTAGFGVPLITNMAELSTSADAVTALLRDLEPTYDGVIISAFGDPGLAEARRFLTCPVTGLCEASSALAGAEGRRFGIATTTPDLEEGIVAAVTAYGWMDQFTGLRLTPGDVHALMADPAALERALEEACRACMADGAQAVIIGGGPLAWIAPRVAPRLPVPIIEPVAAAVGLAIRRADPALRP